MASMYELVTTCASRDTEVDGLDCETLVREMKSDEYERLGFGGLEKRNDFDHVFERGRGVSGMNEFFSVVGVDGGVRAEASTSN